jgi:hypothetical protein
MDPDPQAETSAPRDVAPDDSAEPQPPWYRRISWPRLLAIVFVLLFWAFVGLICTPAYFRF